jgi:hypothetical protein
MFVISLFGYTLCYKALVLCLFSIVSAAVLDVDLAGVPYLSSNVPFPVHDFKWVFHFHDYYRKLFESKYKKIAKIDESYLAFIKVLINDYIRKECENINSDAVEYLWSIQGLIKSNKLKIFTMNYDMIFMLLYSSR